MDVSDWKTSLLVIGLKSLSLRRDYVVIGVSTVSEPTNQYQRTVIPVTVTYAVIIQKAEYPPAVTRYTALTPPSIIPKKRLIERPTGV
jgi:hypothetical protein